MNGYRRELNLATGEATVSWKHSNTKYEEKAFSSRKHNVNVIRLKARNGEKLQVLLSLEETPGRRGKHFEHNLDNTYSSVSNEAIPGWLTFHADYSKAPNGYEGLARVTTKGGYSIQENNKLRIEGAEEILIVIQITILPHQ